MKKTSKEIIRKIKEKEKMEEKANYTFRLTISLMEKFKEKCEREDISMASVLEELLKDFTLQ